MFLLFVAACVSSGDGWRAELPWQRSRLFRFALCGLAAGALALLLNACGGSAPAPTETRGGSAASANGCSFSFKGFSDKEAGTGMWWRWSAGTGEVHIVAAQPIDISLDGMVSSIEPPNTVDVLLNGTQQAQIATPSKERAPLKIASLHLNQGENVLTFVSKNKGIKIPTDSRILAIAIGNLQTHALSGGTCTLVP
jgi:hypothetical protein